MDDLPIFLKIFAYLLSMFIFYILTRFIESIALRLFLLFTYLLSILLGKFEVPGLLVWGLFMFAAGRDWGVEKEREKKTGRKDDLPFVLSMLLLLSILLFSIFYRKPGFGSALVMWSWIMFEWGKEYGAKEEREKGDRYETQRHL